MLTFPRCHAGRCAAGYGLTFVLMQNRIRFGLHKFAKEGLVCLLESCTAKEAEQVRAIHKGYQACLRHVTIMMCLRSAEAHG